MGDRAPRGGGGEDLALRGSRFEDAEILRDGEEMREALRRYVPAAVADELEGGREPFTGRREVSVLFVDMRGYSGMAEQYSSRTCSRP